MERGLSLRNELERRFDGPMPPDKIECAHWSPALPKHKALAERAMWAAAVRHHIRSIRALRTIKGTALHQAAMERELRILKLYFRGANRACRYLRF